MRVDKSSNNVCQCIDILELLEFINYTHLFCELLYTPGFFFLNFNFIKHGIFRAADSHSKWPRFELCEQSQ